MLENFQSDQSASRHIPFQFKMRASLLVVVFLTYTFDRCGAVTDDEGKVTCYVCEDENCATLAESPPTEPCADEKDECVVLIKEKKTIRGCYKQIIKDGGCKEEEYCKKCSGSNCNGGIFPSDRRKCYQCKETDDHCNNLPGEKIKSLPCVLFERDDVCYTFAKGDRMIRGCWSDAAKACEANDPKCAKCKSDNCNENALKREASLKCAKCDKDSKECAWYQGEEPAKCTAPVEYWQQETCFTLKDSDAALSRGCTLESSNCETDDKCDKCAGGNCNNKNTIEFKCYHCDSTDPSSKSCAETAQEISPTVCKNVDMMAFSDRGCYTQREGKTVKRGCLADLSDAQRATCLKATSQSCHHCLEGNCNNKDPPVLSGTTCHTCDDENCATLADPLPEKSCADEKDECVVLIKNKKTIRGCYKEIIKDGECKEEKYCKKCSGSKCNKDIYPEARRKCYQCNEADEHCNNLPGEKIKPLPCALLQRDDECYTFAKGDRMIRGCWSDPSKACEANDPKCAKCKSDNCNKNALKRDASLKCAKCDKASLECAWYQGEEPGKCTAPVEYWQQETCFTLKDSDAAVSRGCTLESNTCDGEDCKTCEGDNCNNKNTNELKCYLCSSADEGSEACAETAEGITSKACENWPTMTFDQRGCYTLREGRCLC